MPINYINIDQQKCMPYKEPTKERMLMVKGAQCSDTPEDCQSRVLPLDSLDNSERTQMIPFTTQ